MSRGQRARTPEHFPRMKHRACGRQLRNLTRHRQQGQAVLEALTSATQQFVARAQELTAFIRKALGMELFPWQERLLFQALRHADTRASRTSLT